MKKYLICGATALIAGLFITSCTHDDIEYKTIVEEKTQAFNELFTELYGESDINHDWGFTPLPNIQEIIGHANASSRAATRVEDKRSNMWASEGWVIPTPLTSAQKNLVRNYFQQNKNPQGTSVDYKNFFVQQVYKGYTNLDKANADCLEIYKNKDNQDVIGSNHMDHLTAGYPPDHINDFNHGDRDEIDVQNNNKVGTHKDAITFMVDSRTNCFGYQGSEDSQIHYDEHSYVIITGETIMNWAKTEGAKLSEASAGADVTGMVFVGFDYFATGSNPNMQSDADGYFSDWIVRITEGVKSSSHSGDPDDPDSHVTTGKKVRIIRHTALDKGRIFCEDLYKASKEDLDFNDVVFDAILWFNQELVLDKNGNIVEYGPSNYDAEIVLIATGATLPLQVADKEVHNVFNTKRDLGVAIGEDKLMVNTVIGSAFNGIFRNSITPVKLTWTTDEGTVNRFDVTSIINNIDEKDHYKYTLNVIPVVVQYQRENQSTATVLSAGDIVNNKMEAPHKICVPIDTPWPGERRNISTAFTKFKDWVNDKEDNEDAFTNIAYRVQDNLYNENWTSQLTNIAKGDSYDEEIEVINEGLLTDYFLTWSNNVVVVNAGNNAFDNVYENDELVIYGERRTPENGSNLDTFLKVKTAWNKNVAFNNADEDEDIYPKLSNGCIRLSLSSTAITKLKEEGLRLDGQAFYIHSVVIEPKQ